MKAAQRIKRLREQVKELKDTTSDFAKLCARYETEIGDLKELSHRLSADAVKYKRLALSYRRVLRDLAGKGVTQ